MDLKAVYELLTEILSSKQLSVALFLILIVIAYMWKNDRTKLSKQIDDLKENNLALQPDNMARKAIELNNTRGEIVHQLSAQITDLEKKNKDLESRLHSFMRIFFDRNLKLIKYERKSEDNIEYCSLCDPESELQDLALIDWNRKNYDVLPREMLEKVLDAGICGYCHGYHIRCGVCGEMISFSEGQVRDELRCDICDTKFVFTPEVVHNPATIHIRVPDYLL